MKNKFGLFRLFSKLGKDRLAGSSGLLARLLRDEDGGYLLYMTMAIPVLIIGIAGLATEGGQLFYQHRTLQSAADAAAYSAAIACSYSTDPSTCTGVDITTQAQATVASYGFVVNTGDTSVTDQAQVTASATTYGSLPAVQVTISRPQSRFFSSYYLSNSQPNSVSATAVLNGGGTNGGSASGGCILALGQNPNTGTNNEPNSIMLQGNPSINATNCGIFSDSTDCATGSYSESLGGNASITAGSVNGSGCINIFGNARVSLPGGVTCSSSNDSACTQQDGTVTDPYAGLWSSSKVSSALSTYPTPCQIPASTTLGPGRYCYIPADGTSYTLTGGIYILDTNCSVVTCPKVQGTTTSVAVKNATLTDNGTGSTLVFTCSSCTSASQWPSDAILNGANGIISLTAPTSGNTAGFVIIGDPSMPLNTPFDVHSNPNVCLLGTAYAPSGEFVLGGTPSVGCNTSSSTFCQQFISNTIQFTGNSTDTFNSGGCSLSGGGTGGNIQKPIASIVTLVD